MIGLLVCLVPAVLAGVIGFVAQRATSEGAYVEGLRVLYVGLIDLAPVGAAWLEWLARQSGVEERSALVHFAFGFLIAGLAGPVCMGVVLAVTRPLRHGLEERVRPERRQPLADGSGRDFGEVILGRGERFSARVVALAGGLRHFLSPRSGWGEAVRLELSTLQHEHPDDSWIDHAASLEEAFVSARPTLNDPP